MSTRGKLSSEGFYHLYNRGIDKRKVFDSAKDYVRFIAALYLCNSTTSIHVNNHRHRGSTSVELFEIEKGDPLVDIVAYCLMPNHFHLLVRQRQENGVSKFMQRLITGYTMYYNTKNERSGALFQGKYKSELASNDRYFKYLISYIHLNPVKLIEPQWKEKGLKNHKRVYDYLESYSYSSYLDYLGTKRPENKIIQKEESIHFNSPSAFKKEIIDWLKYTEVEPRWS